MTTTQEELTPAVKRSMSLDLAGQRVTVLSDTDEARVRDLVAFVNRRLEEVRDPTRRVPTDQIALLAALNIAEELFQERLKSEELRRRLRERSKKLLGAIDAIARQVDAVAEVDDAQTAKGG